MDLRYNHGGGFSISQEAEFQFMGSWLPPTPEKSVPRISNMMPIRRDESQMSRMNWQELPAFPNGLPQKVFNNNTVLDRFWQIDNGGRQGQYSFQHTNLETGIGGPIVEEGRQDEYSFLQDMLEASAICNHIDSSANLMATRNASSFTPQNCGFRENSSTAGIPILQPEVNNYREASSRGLHVTNRTHHSNSNQLRSQHCSPQLYPYGFPLPSHPGYNLNLPPRTKEDTTFNSLQFPPVTPDKTRIWENNSDSTVNTLAEKCSSKERNKQHDLVITTEQVTGSYSGELLHHTGDSSSAVLASSSDEPKESNVGIFRGIDLNKTPQLKPPKRKKHRPKVIVEGKPKRTPKPTPKASDSRETPTGKRKYVRKMALNKSATEHTASVEEILSAAGNTEVVNVPSSNKANGKRKYVRKKKQESETQHECSIGVNLNIGSTEPAICGTDPKTPPTGKRKYERKKGLEESNQNSILNTAKSCRRALKFDLPNPRDQEHNTNIQQKEMAGKERVVLNLNACPEATETSNVANNKMHGTMSVLQISRQNRLHEQSRQLDAASRFSPSKYQKTSDIVAISERQSAEAQSGPTKIQMENLNVNAMYKNTRIPQHIHKQIVFPDRTSYEEVFQNLKSQNNAQSINYFGGNESKRGHCPMEQRNPFVADVVSPSLLSQKVFLTAHHHQKCSKMSQNQIGSEMQASACNMTTCTAAIKVPIQGTIRLNDVNSNGFPSKHSHVPWESHSMINNINERSQKFTADWNIHLMHNVPKMADGSSKVIGVLNGDKLPQVSLHTGSNSAGQMQLKASRTDISKNQQIMEYPHCNLVPLEKGIMQQEENTVKDLKPVKRRGRPPKQGFSTVEDITNQMESLNLNGQEHSALVLYKSGGDVVPYDGFGFLKKRKPRPKVDLDPETERVWKLLMWQEGSEGIEGTNEETDKRWEEERRIFRGRVDSFIARMHLVQGDRRFSKWKGSVVDSVIGVFLTQNVSDHLSSSAFMHLAARFPLKPGKNTSSRSEISIPVEEPVACILNPDTSIKWHEMSSSNITEHQRDSRTSSIERMLSSKTIEHQRDNNISWMERTSNREMHCQSLEEEVLSSQESFGSSVTQVNGTGSSSGSNSEAEDPVTGCKPNSKHGSYSLDLEELYNHIGENSIFERGSRHRHQPAEDIENRQQRQKMETLDSMKGLSTSNMQISYTNSLMQPQAVPSNHWLHTNAQLKRQVERFESFAEESISSWPSATSRFAIEKKVCCPDKTIGLWEGTSCKIPVQKFGQNRNQEPPGSALDAVVSKHSACANSNFQSYVKTHERNESFQRENTIITEPTNLAESLARSQNASRRAISNVPKFTGEVFDAENSSALVDKPTNLGHKLIEPNSKQKVHSIEKGTTQLHANTSKTRKRKAESDKKNAGDWESLRQQVEPNGRKKERSKETMDSLDYEALRCATVKEISETIKERGMNNMLAERIKEFLDRLVTDHGSIDLEWLRDAPPEEAKKYLLSTRGLGLKSVECVRLLTLHHLAFPVDTNVGRIAVRLGWVPLRPLPESLQLHLLELYPILESIQKYLWPRLCKLDQRTLYELHYQLITFGKVFCTKSKPNCNACPMRAECRHFASAFASARLALPGPEEKSIMPKTIPFTTEKNSGIVINPMPLPSLEDNITLRAGPVFGSCVPIVEEPASPEQHIEVVESDIEDTFSEDPDEIPTIKLNMEQFTENLQNYVQSNMELQEVDTSKALVALHPGAASIPTPKLKNISRLRTEHQVYELPDSHPLLRKMHAREPDDPSPYLLAIWTPGETATSIQPPEQQCQFQGTSKLCNEETCFSCNSIREVNSQTVRGTILIPCRTAMRGSFPLNGTYFQVNEVFADHESSINPIDVPRAWIWNLPRRIVYFGTSVSTIFKGLTTEGIQFCFWKGFVCVRGFEQKTRAPRPLIARLHFPASRLTKTKKEKK